MRLTKKLVVTALAATALLAALTTTAFARDFETTNQNIRVVFRPLVLNGSNGTRVSCTVTLEGTFHYRTIRKTVSLIGYITRAEVETNRCVSANPTGITADANRETLPWHLTYRDFEGTLPAARPRIVLNNTRFNLRGVPVFGTCTYTGSPRGIVTGPAGNGINEGAANIIAENGVSIAGSPFGCPSGTFEGRAPVTLLGTTTPVTVTLI